MVFSRILSRGRERERERELLKREELGLSAFVNQPTPQRARSNQVSQAMSADKTSSFRPSDLEREPLAKEAMDETNEMGIGDGKQDPTRSQYGAAYWQRAMRTGCMIMVFTSVVSLACSTSEFNSDNIMSHFPGNY